jgi:beta-glucosidase
MVHVKSTEFNQQDSTVHGRVLSLDEKIDSLLSKMTLDEKIGQMNQYNGFWDVTGPVPNEGNAKKKNTMI